MSGLYYCSGVQVIQSSGEARGERSQMTRLQRLEAMARGEVEPPPVAKLVGFRLASVELGQAVIDFEPGPQHWNPQGTVHGGILCDVADAAMGIALATMLDEDTTFTTVELKINYLRPAKNDPLKVVGRVVKCGRRVGFTDCEVRDHQDRLIATVTSTCLMLPEHTAGY
jgi:uncharacterized protein (TIGR00369 family)